MYFSSSIMNTFTSVELTMYYFLTRRNYVSALFFNLCLFEYIYFNSDIDLFHFLLLIKLKVILSSFGQLLIDATQTSFF